MATILIAPLPVPSHVNSSLRIARSLQKRGHRVIYLGLPEIEEELRAEGFEFGAVFGDILPKGKIAELRVTSAKLRGLRLLWFLRGQIREINKVLRRMVEGELDERFARLRPALLICDEKLRHLSVIAHGLGIPVLQLNGTIPPELIPAKPGTPRGPGRGDVIPGEKLLMALGLVPRLNPTLVQLARKHGYPLKTTPRGQPVLDRFLSPELLLCPREFAEVGGQSAPGEYLYLEPCIDLERREAEFPWERLRDGRLLVLFALGTLADGSKLNRRLLEAGFAAAAQRPEWQFVIAVGSTGDPAAFKAPPNVIAVKVAPQLGLLRKAAVMVNHAGTNSVKECIYFGVPMVSIPLQFDQPDIGRLVEHHGVGRTLPPREVTADRLIAALEEVVRNPAYKRACEALRLHFLQAEASRGAAGPIEEFLAQRTAAPL
nr:glycosyltransferase [Stigmatella hybrida]